jgi:hypothetical protein
MSVAMFAWSSLIWDRRDQCLRTANGFGGAISIGLAVDFHEPDKAAKPVSVEAAIRYLETRDDWAGRTALS